MRHQVMVRYKVPGNASMKAKTFAFDIPFECSDLAFETLLKGKYHEAEFHVDDVFSKL